MDDRFAFAFAGQNWWALPEQALFWPRRRVLLVADLHLEKGSYFAGQGQLLPPYDSHATLDRLTGLIDRLDPAEIWCLGDSFHDPDGQGRLDPALADAIAAHAAARRWLFIAGNHDGLPDGRWGTAAIDEVESDGIVFRHEHDRTDPRPQVSGHFHPKLRVDARGRSLRRPCFACGGRALILPAFGSFTGGLDIDDPVFAQIFAGQFDALVATTAGLARFAQGPVAKMSQDSDEVPPILG